MKNTQEHKEENLKKTRELVSFLNRSLEKIAEPAGVSRESLSIGLRNGTISTPFLMMIKTNLEEHIKEFAKTLE